MIQDDKAENTAPLPAASPNTIAFPVVGLGASAGGINALLRFFEHMPAANGMAFVVILHLSPKHESNIANILQSVTKMPVTQVNDTLRIERNHVYVIAPSLHLLMNDGTLQILPSERPCGRHVAIDLFLRTLAEVHRERAVSIIFSGSGSDGSLGIARIKENGGITMAQSPDEAEYPDMPANAIETGMIDMVLPVVDMPQKLIELWQNAASIRLPNADHLGPDLHAQNAAQLTENALRDIMTTLRQRTNHDFKHYKRATVLRRIERRLQVNALHDIPAYRDFLTEHSDETPLLLKDMLIGVTNFFRDREAFEALEREVIPKIFDDHSEPDQIRAWSLACASGEEAYSIAMLLTDYATEFSQPRSIQVFATDIDEGALDVGRQGLYMESIMADVPPARLRQHFVKEENRFRIKKEIREKVLFAAHNILRDPPFSKLNLICCRNLLIYLDRDIQAKIFEMFHFALKPGGFLFLGSSESAEAAAEYFIPVDKKNRIYRASTVSRTGHFIAPQPFKNAERVLFVKPPSDYSERRKVSLEELHHRLIEQYSPPSVIVDQNSDIVYLSKQVGRFLRYAPGAPTHNLLSAVHAQLQPELRSVLFQVKQTKKGLETRHVRIEREEGNFSVRLVVRPIQEEDALSNLFLVLFEEFEETPATVPASGSAGDNQVVFQLEEELKRTQGQLQSVIEQYEGSSEELKASNEELQAINEELRSATEELETSKEELQSINEELVTVNFELKTKVDETSRINDDLQNFLTATDIGTIFIDRNMRIKRYTMPVLKIFNMIATDLGRPLQDITHRLEYPEMNQDVSKAFDTLQMSEREIQSMAGQWYIVRLLPYRTSEDRIEGLVLTFIDISHRKEAEEKLRIGQERMQFVAASTKDYAIFTMDENGLVTSWNAGAVKLFGYTEEEMIGRHSNILFTPEDQEAHAFEAEMRQLAADGRVEDERWGMRKDGSRFYYSSVVSLLETPKIHGYAKIVRDATNSKWAETRQKAILEHEKDIRRQAEDAGRLRDEFFAVLSHELKQPLNLIQLTAEVLSRLPEAKNVAAIGRAAQTITRTVVGQARIIDDLLDLSRLHTGKLTLSHMPVNLREVVQHAVELMASDAQKNVIDVSIECAEHDFIIDGDVIRIEQIVWNLLSNALKFTPAGGSVVLKLDREGEFARLQVSDTGMGIAPDFLPFVFDMFRQADAGTTRQYGGMGIGLALVRELAVSHGGSVEALSPGPGLGSTFCVRLPIKGSMPLSSSMIESGSPVLTEKRVLLIDDATDVLESFGMLLNMYGAKLTTANNAVAALEAASQAKDVYDLILCDIGMPGMDGYTLLRELRKHQSTARSPALALTGFTRGTDVTRALKAGFHAHIGKPIIFDEFISTLSSMNI